MECPVCGKKIGVTNRKRVSGGYICASCAAKLPRLIQKELGKYTDDDIASILRYEKDVRQTEFTATSSYQKLILDEAHGLFAIDDPKTDVFYCLSLKDVSINCTSPKASGNSVVCDIEMTCFFIHPFMSFTASLAKGIRAKSVRVDDNHVKWSEPPELTMIRSMFAQMMENERQKYNRAVQDDFYDMNKVELMKAETLFMLDEGYDLHEVQIQRDRLLKGFANAAPHFRDTINSAYDRLRESLED